MTVLVASFDGTRVSAAESATDGGVWDKWNASQTPTVEGDFFYQGSNSISNKVGVSRGGVEMDQSTGTHDFSSPDRIWLAKFLITNYAKLNNQGSTGVILYIGSQNTTDQYSYYVIGSDTYPITGGWLIVPIDPTVAGYRDATAGTPDLNNVDYFAVSAIFSGTSKSENVAMDAIDFIDSGEGLLIIHGTAPDPSGTFGDFLALDEGTSGNRWGVLLSKEGVLYCNAMLRIGDGTNETDFDDDSVTIVFPDHRCAAGYCGIKVNASVSGSVILIDDMVFIGRGSAGGTADTRPVYEITGTAGQVVFDACTFRNFAHITLRDNGSLISLINCILDDGLLCTQNGGSFRDNVIKGATTAAGVAFLLCDDPANVKRNDFTHSTGHAIEMTATGTFAFDGNKFTGYSGTGDEAAIFNNSGGLITLQLDADADSPSIRNGGGASTVLEQTVQLILRIKTPSGANLGNAQCAIYRDDDDTELMNEDSNGISGIAQEGFDFPGSNVNVYIRVRKSSGGTRYLNFSANGIITSAGLDVTITMQEDPNVDV